MKPGSDSGPDFQEWKRIFYTSAHKALHTTSYSYIHIMTYAFHILLFCIKAGNGEVPANEAFLWPVSKSILTSQISMSLHASPSLMHNPGLQRQRHHPCDHTGRKSNCSDKTLCLHHMMGPAVAIMEVQRDFRKPPLFYVCVKYILQTKIGQCWQFLSFSLQSGWEHFLTSWSQVHDCI